jgi:hypothetical protein
MSAKMKENLGVVKSVACDILLEHRLSKKHLNNKNNDSIMTRL